MNFLLNVSNFNTDSYKLQKKRSVDVINPICCFKQFQNFLYASLYRLSDEYKYVHST